MVSELDKGTELEDVKRMKKERDREAKFKETSNQWRRQEEGLNGGNGAEGSLTGKPEGEGKRPHTPRREGGDGNVDEALNTPPKLREGQIMKEGREGTPQKELRKQNQHKREGCLDLQTPKARLVCSLGHQFPGRPPGTAGQGPNTPPPKPESNRAVEESRNEILLKELQEHSHKKGKGLIGSPSPVIRFTSSVGHLFPGRPPGAAGDRSKHADEAREATGQEKACYSKGYHMRGKTNDFGAQFRRDNKVKRNKARKRTDQVWDRSHKSRESGDAKGKSWNCKENEDGEPNTERTKVNVRRRKRKALVAAGSRATGRRPGVKMKDKEDRAGRGSRDTR